jgi:CHAT domain-containing protein
LIDLVSADSARNSLDRSISYLEMVTRTSPPYPSVLVDLSAAHMARAARWTDPRELLVALDVVERALELDPEHVPARFNHALLLEQLALDAKAREAWIRYLELDPSSRWADEARQRLDELGPGGPRKTPAVDASSDQIRAFVASTPGEGLTFALEQALGGWGSAVERGDSATAQAHLATARVIGSVLAARSNEHSVVDAVAGIDRITDTAARRALARAHSIYARAHAAATRDDAASADSGFKQVIDANPRSAALRAWALFSRGNNLLLLGQPDAADQKIRMTLANRDVGRYPILAGRAAWALGVIRARDNDYASGLTLLRQARESFAHAGDRERIATIVGIEGEIRLRMGDDLAGYVNLIDALRGLRSNPTSVGRQNTLYVLARAAANRGMPRAARAVEDENATGAELSLRPALVADSRLTRARLLWSAGHREPARAALAQAERVASEMPAAGARSMIEQDAKYLGALFAADDEPGFARAELDLVIRAVTPLRNTSKLIPALIARAHASLALGDESQAERDLDHAGQLYEEQGLTLRSPLARAAVLSQARAVFDSLVMLRVRSGRVREALAAVERGRTFFGNRSTRAAAGSVVASVHQPTVSYAVLGDTVFAWTGVGANLALRRTYVDRDTLRVTVGRARAALERGAPASTWRPALTQLYDWLVRPVADRLGDDGGVVAIVTDRALADVPFAALYDSASRRHVVERHVTRFAPTWNDAAAGDRPKPPETALIVANPLPDAAAASLPSLSGAETEARGVAAAYARPTVLTGATADSTQVASALQSAHLLHFAGHAVFDDAQPQRSYLAMKPRGLSAANIGAMRLPRLKLVVLSACETMRAPEETGSGFDGLAAAFLSAGAVGVVGSTWRVDDRATANLMQEFHRRYARSGDAAAALREAQLAMVAESPSAWGGFRYVGR